MVPGQVELHVGVAVNSVPELVPTVGAVGATATEFSVTVGPPVPVTCIVSGEDWPVSVERFTMTDGWYIPGLA